MRTQADRDFDLASGRELERKDAEIERLRAALAFVLEFRITDSSGNEVAEDSLFEHRKRARSTLEQKAQTR